MVWAAVGASVVGNLLASSPKDKSWKGKAASVGRNRAAIEASRLRAESLLPEKASEIAEAANAALIESERNG